MAAVKEAPRTAAPKDVSCPVHLHAIVDFPVPACHLFHMCSCDLTCRMSPVWCGMCLRIRRRSSFFRFSKVRPCLPYHAHLFIIMVYECHDRQIRSFDGVLSIFMS